MELSDIEKERIIKSCETNILISRFVLDVISKTNDSPSINLSKRPNTPITSILNNSNRPIDRARMIPHRSLTEAEITQAKIMDLQHTPKTVIALKMNVNYYQLWDILTERKKHSAHNNQRPHRSRSQAQREYWAGLPPETKRKKIEIMKQNIFNSLKNEYMNSGGLSSAKQED